MQNESGNGLYNIKKLEQETNKIKQNKAQVPPLKKWEGPQQKPMKYWMFSADVAEIQDQNTK